jgi:hypothetical protein
MVDDDFLLDMSEGASLKDMEICHRIIKEEVIENKIVDDESLLKISEDTRLNLTLDHSPLARNHMYVSSVTSPLRLGEICMTFK